VGIVVSKKVGKAVTRNRVRRRLREALRELLLSRACRVTARGAPSFDLVIVARPESAQADYRQLRAALEQALKKAAIL
jgi:ribonuclease P protein component